MSDKNDSWNNLVIGFVGGFITGTVAGLSIAVLVLGFNRVRLEFKQ